ncbi:MAG TPA: AMP-binding protein [bacterium]|jgi:phenylacetate-CoA ligase
MVETVVYRKEELRPQAQRLAEQEAALAAMVAAAAPAAPALAEQLAAAGLAPADITLERLAEVPVTPKADLPAFQARRPPFGGWLAVPVRGLRRVFVSPGPIFDPEAGGEDYWGFAPALFAAGFRAGQLVLNTFSHHLTPAGSMFDGALGALGCVAVPTGVGNVDIQLRTLLDLHAEGFVGTPSFLAALLERAADSGARSPLEVAVVSGEPLAESLRSTVEDRHGLRVSQVYAIGDIGLIAYECPARNGLHVADRAIVELVDPTTGAPVQTGHPGEVVVTFLSETYPLLRLGTGDLSRLLDGDCPCGRTAPRMERILGRVGDAVKVRGIFLHPFDLERAVERYPEIVRYQAVVTRSGHADELTVSVERAAGALSDDDRLPDAIAAAVREHTRLRATVGIVPAGTIPADARRIEDRRSWE